MPNRVEWNSSFGTGDDDIDARHRAILAQCNALADCLSGDAEPDDAEFRRIFEALMASAREHFAAEDAQLVAVGCPLLDEHRDDADEFEYLAAEIITTENFDKAELQTFLALWWAGHCAGAGRKYREWRAGSPD